MHSRKNHRMFDESAVTVYFFKKKSNPKHISRAL